MALHVTTGGERRYGKTPNEDGPKFGLKTPLPPIVGQQTKIDGGGIVKITAAASFSPSYVFRFDHVSGLHAVRGLEIYGFPGDAIQVYDVGNADGIEIKNNYIHDIGGNAILIQPAAGKFATGEISNNTFSTIVETIVALKDRSQNFIIEGNTFSGTFGDAISIIGDDSDGNRISQNTFFVIGDDLNADFPIDLGDDGPDSTNADANGPNQHLPAPDFNPNAITLEQNETQWRIPFQLSLPISMDNTTVRVEFYRHSKANSSY